MRKPIAPRFSDTKRGSVSAEAGIAMLLILVPVLIFVIDCGFYLKSKDATCALAGEYAEAVLSGISDVSPVVDLALGKGCSVLDDGFAVTMICPVEGMMVKWFPDTVKTTIPLR